MEENQNITNDEIRTLLEENLKLNQEILSICKDIEHQNKIARIYGIIKVVVIVIPLLIGVLYLIPFIGPVFEGLKDYQKLMGDLMR